MDWRIICIFIGFIIYWSYNTISIGIFGIPFSLSQTFYLFKNRENWQKILFPITLVITSLCLLPSWLEISEGSNWQFLVFLSLVGIIFTGFVPTFKSSKMEDKVHTISAIIGAVCALLWVVIVAKMWYVIIMWIIFVLLSALLTNTIKTAYIFWIETITFMATFMSIICYYIKIA